MKFLDGFHYVEAFIGALVVCGLLGWAAMRVWWRVWESFLLARMGVRLHKEFRQWAFTKARQEAEERAQKE